MQTAGLMALLGVISVKQTRGKNKGEFTMFVADAEPKLRHALVAWYGGDLGREAVAEALAWAWQNWDRLADMDNPEGYLFRVGQTHARRHLRRRKLRAPFKDHRDFEPPRNPRFEPGLISAIESLTSRQRSAVVLVHAYGLTHAETAELLGIRRSTVQNHVERGMAKLREQLEVSESE